jgi:hypothetical protein
MKHTHYIVLVLLFLSGLHCNWFYHPEEPDPHEKDARLFDTKWIYWSTDSLVYDYWEFERYGYFYNKVLYEELKNKHPGYNLSTHDWETVNDSILKVGVEWTESYGQGHAPEVITGHYEYTYSLKDSLFIINEREYHLSDE